MMPQFLLLPLLIIGLFLPHFTHKRNILFANIALAAGYGFLMVLDGQYLGALIYCVAGAGSMLQIIMGEKFGKNGFYARTAMAALMVLVGAVLLYKAPVDLIIIAGFAIARFSETLTKPQNIRCGFFVASSLFLMFAGISGVWSVFFIQLAVVTSIALAIALNSGKLPRLQINRLFEYSLKP